MRSSFEFSFIQYLEITHLERDSKLYPGSRIHTFIVHASEDEQSNPKKKLKKLKKNIQTTPTHLQRLSVYNFARMLN